MHANAERAVLIEITVLQLQSPSSTFTMYGKVEAKELKKPSLFNG